MMATEPHPSRCPNVSNFCKIETALMKQAGDLVAPCELKESVQRGSPGAFSIAGAFGPRISAKPLEYVGQVLGNICRCIVQGR